MVMKRVLSRFWCGIALFCFAFVSACSSDPYWDRSVIQRPCNGFYALEFTVEGKFYRVDSYVEVPDQDVGSFYAYLINVKDEEKWREYNNDDAILYIIDERNNNAGGCGPLPDRWMVYTMKDSVDLALDLCNWYIRCLYLGEA